MLYYLFQYLESMFDIPGARLFSYITFRSVAAFILSLFIATIIGRRIINRLQIRQIGELVRDLGLEGQMAKKGTPTMGGIIIIIAILVPCLLVGRLGNIYMILMLVTTVWLGAIGFLDDYIKVFKKDKEGLHGRFKIVGQVGLGLIVGLTLYLSPEVVIRENVAVQAPGTTTEVVKYETENIKSTQTTIPFFKNNNLDYADLVPFLGEHAQTGGWVIFILLTIFVVTAVSNGANLTDGLDGLATGTSAIIGLTLGILAYLSGHIAYASYLNIMYIPGSEELVVFACTFMGATIGFLWYNAYPAQVFMGDTGSLTLGGIIAVFALCIHKELLIPILCAIFFVEDLSVMIQVAYFKITKRKYGEGRRVFKMTPLHHHFQKPGNAGINALIQKPLQAVPESKIVVRFWIVCLMLAAITIVTLKMR
ncbi:phospho-N-acetylmuramoyl-pentapeptide-transferase [Barnesiella viscericola]|uniref:phospho-N-acetylmuramoyl-pentapeptide- transferase n=1 Tax=Barnesiella viscericola TaxID=397865 RepID=UPI0024B63BCD|nr:phospho-N-acetylmuramoyl-pentapeptide-transferase [Barnesiella viscericola]